MGIGGHINDKEKFAADQNVIEAGLGPELDEEIHLLGRRLSLNLVGIISDDSTLVGQMHLGLVFLLETDSAGFTVNEADLMTAEWATVETLRECLARMETWSQIVFEHVISRASVHAPSEVLIR